MLLSLLLAALVQDAPELPEKVFAEITSETVMEHVEGLALFGTRHTLSDVESDERGIGAARRWILSEFERFDDEGRLDILLDGHEQELRNGATTDVVNVVAVLPGVMEGANRRYYYVLGHYDSRASGGMDTQAEAPGANDDGSGTAVVMELARVLADEELDSTVVFLATAGEEQGLWGATKHVEAALADGVDIRAALNNDIVGDPTGPPFEDGTPREARDRIRLFSEGLSATLEGREAARVRRMSTENDGASRQLARFVLDVARRHELAVQPQLIYRPDRFMRGGDHTPFNQNGIAAVRFTEVYENYDRQHQDVREVEGVQYGDLPEFVDGEYLADVARLNAAALIHLANAPSIPDNARIDLSGLGNNTTLTWRPARSPMSPATRSSGARHRAPPGRMCATWARSSRPRSSSPSTTGSSACAPMTRRATAAPWRSRASDASPDRFGKRGRRVTLAGPLPRQRMSKPSACVRVLALFLLALPASAQWATSQGGNSRRDGFVDAVGPATALPGWSVTLKTQFAVQPVVGEGLVIHTRVFDWLSPTGSVIEARDEDSGQLVWSATLPDSAGLYNIPYAIRDGQAYAARAHFNFHLFNVHLYALDAADGSVLWQSEGLMNTHFDASPSFASNGDLLVNGPGFSAPNPGNRHLRIDHTDGSTVWTRPRPEGSSPVTAGGAVFQDRYYLVRGTGGFHEVVRIDISDGTRMYAAAKEGDGSASVASNNLMIGSTGRVYFPYGPPATASTDSTLIAYEDIGVGLRERWRAPMAHLSSSTLGLARDGAVLSFSPAGELVRLNPSTGAVLDRSAPLPIQLTAARITVDRQGKIFVAVSGTGGAPGQLLAYAPDLSLRWSFVLGLSPNTGASLTSKGRLVVSTLFTAIRTFRPERTQPAEPLCSEGARIQYQGGAGSNRNCFFSVDVPFVGQTWVSQVWGQGHPGGATFVGIAFTDAPASGTMISAGELLIDLSGRRFATLLQPSGGGVDTFRNLIPEDASLCGLVAHGQAFVLGGSGLELCNGLDLTLGN